MAAHEAKRVLWFPSELLSPPPDTDPDVHVADLSEAWRSILARAKMTKHHKITREQLSVRSEMSRLLRVLQPQTRQQVALLPQPVVQQGQPVRLVAGGSGFSVSGEGRALTSGAEGDLVQARTASGQLVAGVAQADGVLSVRY